MSACSIIGGRSEKRKGRKFEPETLGEAMEPGKLCNFLLGLGVLEYPAGVYWLKLSITYTLLCYGTYLYILIIIRPAGEEFLQSRKKIYNSPIFSILIYANILELYVTAILGWTRYKKLKSLFKHIQISEQNFSKLKVEKKYSCFYTRQYFFICGKILIDVAMIIYRTNGPLFSKYSLHQRFLFCTCAAVSHTVSTLTYSCYVVLISFYGERFYQLRGLLKKLRKRDNTLFHDDENKHMNCCTDANSIEISKYQNDSDVEELISDVRYAHLELVRVSTMTNSVYGLQIITTLAFSFGSCTAILYLIWALLFWTHPETLSVKGEIELLLGWLTSFAFKLIMISCVCGSTTNQAKAIGSVVCQLHEPSASSKLRAELTNFVFQLVENKLTFEPRGIVLNYSTLAMIVSTMFSLLIFLIQVREIPAFPSIMNETTWVELEDKLHLS